MQKETTIKHSELRALLFWATNGIVRSNGGTHARLIPRIIKKYAKEVGYTETHWGFLVPIQSQCKNTLEMSKNIKKALIKVFPKKEMDINNY